MSWQAYVDSSLVGTGTVKQGAIFGHDGSQWAVSPGFSVSGAEAKTLAARFSSPSPGEGFSVAGVKYMTLKNDDRSLYGKKGATGVVVVKSGQAILVGTYDENIQPGQCTNTVEKLADYLIDSGY